MPVVLRFLGVGSWETGCARDEAAAGRNGSAGAVYACTGGIGVIGGMGGDDGGTTGVVSSAG